MTSSPGTRVTCVDQSTGKSETTVLVDDHLVVTDGRSYVSSVVAYANGTQIWTLKKANDIDTARAHQPSITRHFGRAGASS